jgi:glycosyltransferase involved in cell wall biosynthesis
LARHGLIVTYYFPPAGGGGVQRWIKLIKYLSRLDWKFTVVTAPVEETTPHDPSLLDDLPENTEVIRTLPDSGSSPGKKRLGSKMSRTYFRRWLSSWYYVTDSRGSWNSAAATRIKEQLVKNKFDVLIFSLPPYSVALLAAEFSNQQPVTVGLDMRDPWTINPYKIYPTFLHRWIDRKRECESISKIDFLISAYESIPEYFTGKVPGFEPARCLVLPNGYDEADFQDLPEYTLPVKGNFHLAFSGSFYSHLNNPDQIFTALKILREQGMIIHFHHLGTSVYDVSKRAAKFSLHEQFHGWGYQTHRECLAILNGMDGFVLILDERIRNAEKTVGGKLYEYLRLKKPVLAIVPEQGEAARIIRETDSGIVCSGPGIDAVVQAIKDLHGRQRKFSFKNIELYDRQHQAERLNYFLEEMIAAHKKKQCL